MKRLEPDYRPLRGAILGLCLLVLGHTWAQPDGRIWIPLVLFGCAVIWYRLTQ